MGRNLGPLNIKDTYEGLVQISGSQLTDGSGSLIPSLDVTASFASQAGTSGYASTALSSSYAVTASYAENAIIPNLQQVTDIGATTTNVITAGDFTVGNRTYGQDAITSAVGGGTYSIRGGTNLAQLQLTGNNSPATNSITLKGVGTNDLVTIVGNTKIDDDLYVVGDITGSNIQTDNLTATSASIGHLTTVTGSAVIIGDAYVVVNSSATTRYAGIKVYESGSVVPTTASLEFDSQTNDWFYEYTGSDPTNFGVVMFGPEYSTKGSPTYPTANTLVKGNGGHHVVDSSITDDGTDVVVNANISASGFISASTYYGDGSNLSGLTVVPFPYTGSAEITGSLRVIDQIIVGAANNTITKQTGDENYAIVGGGTNTINHTSANAFGDNIVMVGGYNNTITGAYLNETSIFGGRNHTITAAQYSTIVGGSGNSISSEYNHIIVGGSSNSITAQTNNGVFAGNSNTANGNAAVVLGGSSNAASSTQTAVLGGNGNTASHNRSVVIGGTGISSDAEDTVFTPSIKATGSLQVIDANSTGNTIYMKGGTLRLDTDSYNSWAGIDVGQGNTLSPALGNTAYVFGISNNNGSANGGFVHGENNTVNSPSYGSVIIGAYGATLGASFSGIFAGTAGNNGHNNSVILGGDSLATSKTEEAVVQHLSIYGDTYISSSTLGTGSLIDNLGQEGVGTTTAIEHMVYCTQAEYAALTPDANTMYVISGSGEVVQDLVVSGSIIGEVTAISVASSTGSLDCSVGNYFTLGLANAADTRLEASNIQTGQTINIKITNNATAAGTISFGPEFEFEGGTAFTATAATSAVDIITLVSFDGTSLQTVGVKNFS